MQRAIRCRPDSPRRPAGPFCAFLASVLFAFIGDSKKHQPNPRTCLDRTTGNATIYRSPKHGTGDVIPPIPHSKPMALNEASFKSLYLKRPYTAPQRTPFARSASDTAIRLLGRVVGSPSKLQSHLSDRHRAISLKEVPQGLRRQAQSLAISNSQCSLIPNLSAVTHRRCALHRLGPAG